MEVNKNIGGGGEIRTHGGGKPSPVFKTGALNRSATPPIGRQEYSKNVNLSLNDNTLNKKRREKRALIYLSAISWGRN